MFSNHSTTLHPSEIMSSSGEDPGQLSTSSDLSEFEKGQIVGAYLGGLSVKDVSRMCHVSCLTVSEILDLYKLYLELKPGLKRKSQEEEGMKTRMKRRVKEAQNGQTKEETLEKETKDEGTNAKKTGSGNKAQACYNVPTENVTEI